MIPELRAIWLRVFRRQLHNLVYTSLSHYRTAIVVIDGPASGVDMLGYLDESVRPRNGYSKHLLKIKKHGLQR